MPRLSRLALAFLLTAVLASMPALAASPLPGPVPGLRAAEASAATHAVARLWSFLASLWSKNGCHVDPDGHCLPSTGPTGENGCEVDPNGLCLPGTGSATPTEKNGCHVDPSGHCRPGNGSATPAAKNGCQLDPNGHCRP
jgi:hypothetical protein